MNLSDAIAEVVEDALDYISIHLDEVPQKQKELVVSLIKDGLDALLSEEKPKPDNDPAVEVLKQITNQGRS